jgi:hypothetical protein
LRQFENCVLKRLFGSLEDGGQTHIIRKFVILNMRGDEIEKVCGGARHVDTLVAKLVSYMESKY